MRTRGFARRLPIVIAALLLPLLVVLAVLQWHWIGEVSAMERQRMRASLTTAGSRFTHEFDREIARAFLTFHPGPTEPPRERLERALRQYRRWTSEAPYPHLIRDVFLVQPGAAPKGGNIQVLRPSEGRFERCPWPAELAGVRRRLEGTPSPPAMRHGVFEMRLWLDGDIPALVVPLVFFPAPRPREVARQAEDPLIGALLVLRFNREVITNEIFPALTRQHFETPQGADYAVAVVDAHDPRRVLYRSDPRIPVAAFEHADLSLGLLTLRPFEDLRLLDGRHEHVVKAREAPRQRRHFTFWQGKATPPHEVRPREPGGELGGEWRLLAKRREGSLEQAVLAVRHRNLGVSLGILALLAATTGILVVATQRAQRLARQQIEFVAGVTHELHTPLTAIRSAGQNLADGVVADPAQVRRYGALIEGEGRRLSDMVGQALEFAGIQSGRRVYHPRPVEVGEIVDGALEDCRWRLEEKRVEVERSLEAGLPAVLADPAALRRAVANLVENAVKYGGRSGWIGIEARRAPSGGVEITVADRGPGIRKEDLPRLFEPFFRGRDAAAGAVPGSGLGLSLVRHIAEAHGGRVTVTTETGKGSAFTLHLPAAAPAVDLRVVEKPA